jgi:hypothetical protein
MISTQQYHEAAMRLNVETAAIKAVDEVESGGSGFLNTGEPVILFEPHIFFKELKKREVDPHQFLPENEDILYEKWGTRPYKKSYEQHAILKRAVAIHREAALCSASWGRYQIMGFNFRACGCASIQEFINAIYKDEAEHLRLFCNFLKSTGLDTHLRNKDWRKFAKGYNGPSYEVHKYHLKLNTAYIKHSR